jgi:hypothetical protein
MTTAITHALAEQSQAKTLYDVEAPGMHNSSLHNLLRNGFTVSVRTTEPDLAARRCEPLNPDTSAT